MRVEAGRADESAGAGVRGAPTCPVHHMTSKQTAFSRDIATGETGWAPRLAQEARLTELEARLARQPHGDDTVDIEVERAALLGALNRPEQAQQAFIEL